MKTVTIYIKMRYQKNGNLAGKIFEKDLKIQKLEKAIKKAIELLSIDGEGTKKQVLNLLKEVLENVSK